MQSHQQTTSLPVSFSSVLLLVFGLNACSTYGDKVAPIPLPSEQTGGLEVNNVGLYAEAYLEQDAAEQAFGFDIRGAGVLPVRFVLDNQSEGDIEIRGDQTFLIDAENQAWPLLTYDQAYRRVNQHVELGETAKGAAKPAVLLAATGALVGAAVGVVTGDSAAEGAGRGAAAGAAAGAVIGGAKRYQEIGQEIREDLAHDSFDNRSIETGEIAHGFLFFPGNQEISSLNSLRVSIIMNDQPQTIKLTLHEKI
ncbi:MAG: glycine zipper domain-containing protein [Gammaproteobacteria bacterium]|nr:glycine zipper domain-containing protein [Gammaproteobacteria bacterium]